MKTIILTALVAAGIAAAVPQAVAAAVKSKERPAAVQKERAQLRPLAKAALLRRGAVAKRLELTDEQKTALKAERQEAVAAVKAIRRDAGLVPTEKMGQARAALKEAREEARAQLSEEQIAKLQELRQLRAKRLGRR